jgi:RHH-type rel operon transcriptional repressor/antitoxin RelB
MDSASNAGHDLRWSRSPDIQVYQLLRLNMLAVRLPIEIERRLDALAKATGRTKTFYVREAILEHLEDLEDLYLAEREVKAVRAGKSKTISLEKLMKQYGLED